MSTFGTHIDLANKDEFRTHIFYSILDSMVGEIEQLFTTSNCNILKGMHALSPNRVRFLGKKGVQLLVEGNKTDVKDFIHELQ